MSGLGPDATGTLRFVLDNLPDVVLLLDGAGIVRYANAAAQRLLGYDPETQIGRNAFELVHPDDAEYALGALGEVVRKEGEHLPVELRIRHADGGWVDLELQAETPRTGTGESLAVLTLRPVAGRGVLPERRRRLERLVQGIAHRCAAARAADLEKVIEQALADLGAFFEASAVVLGAVDHGHGLLHLDHEWAGPAVEPERRVHHDVPLADLLWTPESVGGRTFVLVPDLLDVLPGAGNQQEVLLSLGLRSVVDIPVLNGDVLVSVLSLRWSRPDPFEWDDAHHELMQTVGNVLAVTEQRLHAERRLRRQALHDQLTGLPNRAALSPALRVALDRLTRVSGTVALLFVDLDGFKPVNDRFGHDRGDLVLVEMAQRIRRAVRPGDMVCRLGGDEFVVLCQDLGPGDAETVARRIGDAVAEPVPMNGTTLHLTASVGVAATDVRADPDELLRRADRAMYQAKRDRA